MNRLTAIVVVASPVSRCLLAVLLALGSGPRGMAQEDHRAALGNGPLGIGRAQEERVTKNGAKKKARAPALREERETARPRRQRNMDRKTTEERDCEKSENECVKRWSALSEERKREIRALFQRIQKLPRRVREELMATLRGLDEHELRRRLARAERKARCEDPLEEAARRIGREIFAAKMRALPPAERKRVGSLDAEGRRKYFCDRLAWERRQLLATLPPEAREVAEALPPREQARFLRRFRGEETSRRVFPAPAERAYLAGAARPTLARLLQAGTDAAVVRPAAISERSWKRWLELEPYERLRVLRHLSPSPDHPSRAKDRSKPGRHATDEDNDSNEPNGPRRSRRARSPR